MQIKGFAHKSLKRLYMEDDARGLPAEAVDKLRKMLAFLQDMPDLQKLRAFPMWKPHQLTGGRKSVWSLNVTRNWRLTFRVENGEIHDVNLEDYH